MLHAGGTEPPRRQARRKLFTWGKRATLLIWNRIFAAGTARKRTWEPVLGRATPAPPHRTASGSRNRRGTASRSRLATAARSQTPRPAGRFPIAGRKAAWGRFGSHRAGR